MTSQKDCFSNRFVNQRNCTSINKLGGCINRLLPQLRVRSSGRIPRCNFELPKIDVKLITNRDAETAPFVHNDEPTESVMWRSK